MTTGTMIFTMKKFIILTCVVALSVFCDNKTETDITKAREVLILNTPDKIVEVTNTTTTATTTRRRKTPSKISISCPKDWCTCDTRTLGHSRPCLTVYCNQTLRESQKVSDYLLKLPKNTCKLIISNTKLPQLSLAVLDDFEKLREIHLINCSITNLSDILVDVPAKIKSAIRTLQLPSNIIENATGQPFLGFVSVYSLNLKENRITMLDRDYFTDLLDLTYLNLANNKIKVLESHTFEKLIKLDSLVLDSNEIYDIQPGAFYGLNVLESMALSSNRLTSIKPGALLLPNMTSLRMENNALHTLTKSVIEGPNLKIVHLQNNNISVIDKEAIPRFKAIKYCYINNNALKSISYEALQKFNDALYRDTAAMLRYNPWQCDCQLTKLILKLKQLYQKDHELLEFTNYNEDRLRCDSPEHIKGKSLTSLAWSDLNCNNTLLSRDECHVEVKNVTDKDSCKSLRNKLCLSNPTSCTCSQQKTKCYVCPAGYYGEHRHDPPNCSACPVLTTGGYGAQILSQCQCMEGFQYINKTCEECPMNTFKKDHGNHQCQPCLPNSYTIFSASTTCDCELGYVKDESSGICRSQMTNSTEMKIKSESNNLFLITIAVSSTLATAGILTAILYYYVVKNRIMNCRKKEVKLVMNSILENINQQRASENNYINNDILSGLIIEMHQIKFEKILGQGAFGQVHKATVTGLKKESGSIIAAVKTLRASHTFEEKDALYKELQQLLYVGHHPNIINLLGFVSADDVLMIVLEYSAYGDLHTYLKGKTMSTQYAQLQFNNPSTTTNDIILENASTSSYIQPNGPSTDTNTVPPSPQAPEVGSNMVDTQTLLSVAWQVAKGMNHLSQMKCIHRDLAARNVLLSTGMVAKVSDFGLARAVYESGYYFKETKGRLPFKWMPPEAILEGQYTTKSDVWSYGVLLWEIYTLGGNPYPGIPIKSLLDLLESGYRMTKPNNCPADVFELMRDCWRERPCDRPSFDVLSTSLDEMLQKAANSEYMEVHDDTKDPYIHPYSNSENIIPYDYLEKGSPKQEIMYHNTSQRFMNLRRHPELDRLLPIPNIINGTQG